MGGVLVKGSAITSRERWVREHHGAAGERQFLEALDPSHAERLRDGVLRSAWVPFELFLDVNLAADRVFGGGDLAICREMGRYGGTTNLPTLYRIFFRVGSLPFVLKRAARMWDVHYSSGRLSVTDGPGWARLTIQDFAEPHPALWESVAGWGEATAMLTGHSGVHATIEQGPTEPDQGAARIVIRFES